MQIPAASLLSPSLAIVGASARSAAASTVRAGFRPLSADLFADADLRAIATTTRIAPYPDGLLDWLRGVEPAAWMYTGALENHPELVDQMGWVAPLWGNPGDVLARVRSPWELADVLRSAGLLFPETRPSADGLPQDGSWLLKTYRGASGSGVREWSRGQGAGSREHLLDSPISLLHAPCCYQRRVAGTSCAAVFVAAGGAAALLGITRQLVGEAWVGAHGFQYAGTIGPWPVSDTVLATITDIGNALAKHFELVGLFGVDMIVENDSVWTIEVNPRYTASVEIIERATGIQAIAAHAAACAARPGAISTSNPPATEFPILGPHLRTHGKAILFARRALVVSKQFVDSALGEALRAPWPMLADISAGGTLIEAGRPVLTVFADGKNTVEVEHQLRERVTELEHDLYSS